MIDILWNTPEGFLTLVTEYYPGNTLANILFHSFTFPEHFINRIFNGIIKAVKNI